MKDPIVLGVLAVLASLSPLLTFLRLFQMKEWRLDRLREHLRREGSLHTLFGVVRPTIILLAILTSMAYPILPVPTLALGALALVSLTQIALKRQHTPVWTQKALLVALLSMAATTLCTATLLYGVPQRLPLILLIPLLQPSLASAVWMALLPLDQRLKWAHFSLARSVRSSLPSTTTIIAIAGSVGKTTTKELLSHVLQDLSPAATPAHVNTEMGVAQWLANIGKKNPPVLIVEMGAYKKGEISLMCSIAQPTIGVLTAVGSDHLGLFGSEKAIVDANAELLAALPVTGTAFVNADSQGARSATAVARSKVVLAGRAADAYERMTDVKETEKGVSLSYNNHTFVCPLRGVHNASNIFLAIQVAKQLGISITRIAELLTTFTPLPHTFQVHMEHGIILLDDTYNASRLSMMAALEWAMDRPERPRVLLTGGVLELGQAEASIMQEIGLHAQGAVERAIFVGSKGASSFSKGFARPVEKWSRSTPRLQPGSLLLCVGRMPLSTIQRVLPSPQSTKASAA